MHLQYLVLLIANRFVFQICRQSLSWNFCQKRLYLVASGLALLCIITNAKGRSQILVTLQANDFTTKTKILTSPYCTLQCGSNIVWFDSTWCRYIGWSVVAQLKKRFIVSKCLKEDCQEVVWKKATPFNTSHNRLVLLWFCKQDQSVVLQSCRNFTVTFLGELCPHSLCAHEPKFWRSYITYYFREPQQAVLELCQLWLENVQAYIIFSLKDLRDLFRLEASELDSSVTQKQLHDLHAHQRQSSSLLTSHLKDLEQLPGFIGIFKHSV